jgi:hypothetical protein
MFRTHLEHSVLEAKVGLCTRPPRLEVVLLIVERRTPDGGSCEVEAGWQGLGTAVDGSGQSKGQLPVHVIVAAGIPP